VSHSSGLSGCGCSHVTHGNSVSAAFPGFDSTLLLSTDTLVTSGELMKTNALVTPSELLKTITLVTPSEMIKTNTLMTPGELIINSDKPMTLLLYADTLVAPGEPMLNSDIPLTPPAEAVFTKHSPTASDSSGTSDFDILRHVLTTADISTIDTASLHMDRRITFL